jgi:hypothetical protein
LGKGYCRQCPTPLAMQSSCSYTVYDSSRCWYRLARGVKAEIWLKSTVSYSLLVALFIFSITSFRDVLVCCLAQSFFLWCFQAKLSAYTTAWLMKHLTAWFHVLTDSEWGILPFKKQASSHIDFEEAGRSEMEMRHPQDKSRLQRKEPHFLGL